MKVRLRRANRFPRPGAQGELALWAESKPRWAARGQTRVGCDRSRAGGRGAFDAGWRRPQRPAGRSPSSRPPGQRRREHGPHAGLASRGPSPLRLASLPTSTLRTHAKCPTVHNALASDHTRYDGRDRPCDVEKIQMWPSPSTEMTGLSCASLVFLSRRIVGRGTVPVRWS